MRNLLYYMEFGKVSVTPYCNYSFLLPDVSCNTIRDLVEYELLFSVAIFCCILTISYYISYVFHEALLAKLSIV